MVRMGDYIHGGCVMYTVGFRIIISEQVLCGFLGSKYLVLKYWFRLAVWISRNSSYAFFLKTNN